MQELGLSLQVQVRAAFLAGSSVATFLRQEHLCILSLPFLCACHSGSLASNFFCPLVKNGEKWGENRAKNGERENRLLRSLPELNVGKG